MSTRPNIRSVFVLLAVLATASALAQTQSAPSSTGTGRGNSLSAFQFTDMYPGDDNATMERSRFTPVKREHLRPRPVMDGSVKNAAEQPAFAAGPMATPSDAPAGFGDGLPFYAEMERAGASRPWGRYLAIPGGATGMISGSGRRCPPTGERGPLERVTRTTTMLGEAPAALQRDRIRLLNAQPKWP